MKYFILGMSKVEYQNIMKRRQMICVAVAAVQAASSSNTLALIEILFIVLAAVGFSGIARVLRQHAWEENVYFRYEFMRGIRQNAGSFALLGLLTGMIRFACIWFQNMLLVNGGDAYDYVGYLPAAWAVILLLPAALYLMVCIPIYDVRFYQNVKTAFMVYFKNLWKSLLMTLSCMVVYFLPCIPGLYVHILSRFLVSLVTPLIVFGWFTFAYDRLDECVNERYYPQLVGRGVIRAEV